MSLQLLEHELLSFNTAQYRSNGRQQTLDWHLRIGLHRNGLSGPSNDKLIDLIQTLSLVLVVVPFITSPNNKVRFITSKPHSKHETTAIGIKEYQRPRISIHQSQIASRILKF